MYGSRTDPETFDRRAMRYSTRAMAEKMRS